jgi:hypothetical protein
LKTALGLKRWKGSMTQEVHRAIAPSLVEALNKLFANRVFASRSQLAAVLGLSVKTLSWLGDAGKIGWRPKGSSKQPHRNYAREDVEAYLRGERPCPVYLPRRKDGSTRGANYLFDFRLKPKGSSKSQRFHGSTGQATLRVAERVEARLKELAKLGQLGNAMTIAEACEKYWDQKMQHVRSAKDQATNLEVVSTYLSPETLLVDITPPWSPMPPSGARARPSGPIIARRRRSS